MSGRRVRCAVLACGILAGYGGSVLGQVYPVKPVRIINSYAAGGSVDIVARPLAQRLTEALGQPVIVDNRPGAAGNAGADVVAKAAPDGYTVLIATTAQLTINPHLYKKLPYDPVKDFAPVTLLTLAPIGLVVHPSLPVTSVKALIAFAKARPDQLTYSSAGNGSINHLTTELFMMQTGVRMTHVPYKGGAPAFQDVVAGQIHLMFPSASTMMPFSKSGKVRALAVNASKRLSGLPDVPTMQEAGLTGVETSTGIGLAVPTGTPGSIVSRLHAEAVKIMPELRAMLAAQGVEVIATTPQGFAQFLREEFLRWERVVKFGKIEAG